MFRLTAPKSGEAYYLVRLQSMVSGGLPSVLLAIPVLESEEAPYSNDLFKDRQQGKVGKDKGYLKMSLSGDCTLKGSLASDKVKRVIPPTSDSQIIRNMLSCSTGDDGFYPYSSARFESYNFSYDSSLYDTVLIGFVSSGSCSFYRTGMADNTDDYFKSRGSHKESFTIEWSTTYGSPSPTLNVVIRSEFHLHGTRDADRYSYFDLSEVASNEHRYHPLTLERGSRVAYRSTYVYNRSYYLRSQGSGSLIRDMSSSGNGDHEQSSLNAICLGTFVSTVNGWAIVNRFLGPNPQEMHWRILSDIRKRFLDNTAAYVDSNGVSQWSLLQEKATEASYIISNNMWMFVQDVTNLREDLMNLTQAGKKLGKTGLSALTHPNTVSVKEIIQDIDNVYLPVKYGYGLTISEAWDIGNKITSLFEKYRKLFSNFQMRARTNVQTDWGTVVLNYLANVKVKDNAWSQLYAAVFNSGFWPTLVNAWDFIPYSFCVDWFVSVGELLAALDSEAYRCNLDATSVVRSYIFDEMILASLAIPSLSAYVDPSVALNWRYYDRWVNRTFDPPPLQLTSPLIGEDPRSWTHYTEFGALVTQRL